MLLPSQLCLSRTFKMQFVFIPCDLPARPSVASACSLPSRPSFPPHPPQTHHGWWWNDDTVTARKESECRIIWFIYSWATSRSKKNTPWIMKCLLYERLNGKNKHVAECVWGGGLKKIFLMYNMQLGQAQWKSEQSRCRTVASIYQQLPT